MHDGGRGTDARAILTPTRVPWASRGLCFEETDRALPWDNPLLQEVAAAPSPVSGDGQLAPGHLRGKEHTCSFPELPGRWQGLSRARREAAPPSAGSEPPLRTSPSHRRRRPEASPADLRLPVGKAVWGVGRQESVGPPQSQGQSQRPPSRGPRPHSQQARRTHWMGQAPWAGRPPGSRPWAERVVELGGLWP